MTLVPSAIIAGVAYGAGVLVFNGKKKKTALDYSIDKKNVYEILKQGKERVKEIEKINLEDKELLQNVNQICNNSNKILDIISKNPAKLDSSYNFLNYYLPVTIRILNQYDEVENHKLTSKDSKEFMLKVQKLIKNIKLAFEKQLNNMYESEIINTEADIKVFESMLKSDGFIEEWGGNDEK